LIWKVKNDIIFNQSGLDWEKLLEEIKILSWNILRARSKGFNCVLNLWRMNPLACMRCKFLEQINNKLCNLLNFFLTDFFYSKRAKKILTDIRTYEFILSFLWNFVQNNPQYT
jgi:hypothetical protein